MDTFSDGDELRPLPCSHCFHRACVDEWLLGLKSDERTFTNNCPCCRQDISPGVSNPNIALTSFSFTVDDDEVRSLLTLATDTQCSNYELLIEYDILISFLVLFLQDDVSCGSSSTPTVGCAIPRESFQRLGQYLSASDIGTSKTLSERFNDEDSNLASDADSEEASDVINEQSDAIARAASEQGVFSNGRESYCEQNLLDLSADSRLSEVPRETAHVMTYEDRFSMTENHFNQTGRRVDLDADADADLEQGEAGDDEDCILGVSSVSNVSICTATNNIDPQSNGRSNAHTGRRRNNVEEDTEGSVVSDMEEEYFMGCAQAGPDVPFDALGGSLYSNCGVPLKAASPPKGPI